ncbi:MAG: hypothetical protein DHS20C21_23080 [Gemmatimonadota bacterium]|nr:MAG: hypothetical protein DHS20C21_23080 [Gemmatimonadota bacterium]
MGAALGRLEGEAARAVDGHAAECPECRDRLSLLRSLRAAFLEMGEALVSEHPTSNRLVAWVERPDAIEESERRRLEAHLTLCASCEEDVARVRAVGAELGTVPDPARTAPTRGGATAAPGTGEWRRLLRLLRAPELVPAFAVAAVLVIPAALGVRSWLAPAPAPEATFRGVAPPVVLTREVERGPAPATVTAAPDASITLMVSVDARAASQAVDAEILDAAGSPLWSVRELPALDEFGSRMILIDPGALAPGDHTLVTSVRNVATGDILSRTRWPFRVAPVE